MYFITLAKPVFYSDYGVAYLDKQLSAYYYSLLPKYYMKQRQKYPPHITFLRKSVEAIPNLNVWENFRKNGLQDVAIMYNGDIQFSSPYFFLNAWSEELADLRESLGLSRYRSGFDCFHITVGNIKCT